MKKETVDMVKEALLGSILETKDQDDLNLDQVVRNTNNPRYCTIKRYGGRLNTKNNRIIIIVGNQRLLLKRFKEERGFLDLVGLRESHTYFKIRLYDILSGDTLLKNSNLVPSYFKNDFKLTGKASSKHPSMLR